MLTIATDVNLTSVNSSQIEVLGQSSGFRGFEVLRFRGSGILENEHRTSNNDVTPLGNLISFVLKSRGQTLNDYYGILCHLTM